ncbi:MAG: hypothetical protein L0241_12680 [Planctomycetia bacterium]|nr:hypothetical protein [Planctomycetia bacterium]
MCETGEVETGGEKIALYALASVPTHAARQLPDGKWTSKLGRGPLVRHNTTHGVEGQSTAKSCAFFDDQPSPSSDLVTKLHIAK